MAVQVDLSKCKIIAPGVYSKNDKTYYIKCSISDTICYCNDVRLKKLIDKYGSVEAIGQKYVSREAKQANKPVLIDKPSKSVHNTTHVTEPTESTTTDQKVVKKYLPRPSKIMLNDIDEKVGLLLSNSWERCLRPDIFKLNHGYCNSCSWHSGCEYVDKEWKSIEDQKHRNSAVKKVKDFLVIPTQHENITRILSKQSK